MHGGELRADEIQPQIVELLLGKCFAAQAELQNGHVRSAILNDERGRRTRRHDPQKRLANRCDLRDARFHFSAFMKKNFDDRDAVVTLRLDVLNVVDRGRHRALADRDETLFHFFGCDARVAPNHADDWDVDSRKNVRGHPRDRHDSKQHDEDGHHREGVWPS